MSDAPPPGWWQASDGRWYPPELAPGQQPEQPQQPHQPQPQAPGQYIPPSPYASTYGSQYGEYGSPYQGPPQTASTATLSLVLSILSWVFCPVVLAIAGLVTAAKASTEIRESQGRLTGESMVTASKVIAILNIVVSVLAIAGLILFVAALGPVTSSTFEDAADRAADRATTSELRLAHIAVMTYRSQHGTVTNNPEALEVVEPDIDFQYGQAPASEDVVVISVMGDQVSLASTSHTARASTCAPSAAR